MLMLVVFCYFGTFNSAVQAQISSNNVPTESSAPPNFEPDLSIDNGTSNLETTTQNVLYQQIEELISKLRNEIETKSQIKEYEQQIKFENDNITVLRNEIDISTVHVNALKRNESLCRINQLCKLEGKLNQMTVTFLFQRNTTYKKRGTIPFSIKQLNVGDGMDATSGVFTAPVPGIYHFYFSGLKTKAEDAGTSSLIVQLIKKSPSKREILAEGHVNSQERYGWFPVNVQATVGLKKGDVVHVHLVEGSLYGSGSEARLVTEFGGFLTRPF